MQRSACSARRLFIAVAENDARDSPAIVREVLLWVTERRICSNQVCQHSHDLRACDLVKFFTLHFVFAHLSSFVDVNDVP
jgi:hypothetical protein